MKKLMVGDVVGLLISIHRCSFLLNAFENQTQWRRNKRKTADAATGQSSNNVFSSRHVSDHLEKAILLSQTVKKTPPKGRQRSPRSRWLVLPSIAGPAAHAGPPNREATQPTFRPPVQTPVPPSCSFGAHQLHCMICQSGCGVDQRHSALARCLADLITTHTGTKVHTEQTTPGLSRVTQPGAQAERSTHGRRVRFCVAARKKKIQRLSHRSLPTQDSSRLPAPAQATWRIARKREGSTDIPASTWSHSSSKPRPKIHQSRLQRHGPPTNTKPTWTFRNNTSKPSPRDLCAS